MILSSKPSSVPSITVQPTIQVHVPKQDTPKVEVHPQIQVNVPEQKSDPPIINVSPSKVEVVVERVKEWTFSVQRDGQGRIASISARAS